MDKDSLRNILGEELSTFADKQNVELDKRLNKEFAIFAGQMNKRFDEIDKKLEAKAGMKQVDQVLNTVDGIAKRLDTDDTEQAAMGHQLKRHESWISQLAKSTGTNLSPQQD